MKAARLSAILLAALAVAAAAWFLAKNPGPRSDSLEGLLGNFVECLPADLSEAQVEEIKGILVRYESRVREGKVAALDGAELSREFQRHVAADSISRPELNQLMAKVSYYMYREDPFYNPPDGSAMHPLLETQDADSTSQP
ncbi:MAG: hypothetical protein ACE5EO_11520 [Candidatus Krumholzibacteriia bacterium]